VGKNILLTPKARSRIQEEQSSARLTPAPAYTYYESLLQRISQVSGDCINTRLRHTMLQRVTNMVKPSMRNPEGKAQHRPEGKAIILRRQLWKPAGAHRASFQDRLTDVPSSVYQAKKAVMPRRDEIK